MKITSLLFAFLFCTNFGFAQSEKHTIVLKSGLSKVKIINENIQYQYIICCFGCDDSYSYDRLDTERMNTNFLFKYYNKINTKNKVLFGFGYWNSSNMYSKSNKVLEVSIGDLHYFKKYKFTSLFMENEFGLMYVLNEQFTGAYKKFNLSYKFQLGCAFHINPKTHITINPYFQTILRRIKEKSDLENFPVNYGLEIGIGRSF